MAAQQVKAQITKASDTIGKDNDTKPNPALGRVGVTYEATADFPADLAEAQERWGAELCYNRLMGAVVIDCQSAMRTFIKSEDFSEVGLDSLVADFNPKVKAAGVSFNTKVEQHIASLSPEALQAMLEKVQAAQAA